jgi:hypothetical protein
MSSLLFVRLGTGDLREGHKTLYAVLDGGTPVDMYTASNPDEGLAMAREIAKDRPVECEDALTDLAHRRRATTRELTPYEKVMKLHIAAPMFEPTTYGKVLDDRAVMDFFEAASAFARTVASDPRDEWFVGATLRGTVAGQTFDRELFLLVLPGQTPGLHILSKADADWVFEHEAQTTDVDHMAITFLRRPQALVELADPAYGLTVIPHVEVFEQRQQRQPNDVDFEVLAACMAVIARHVAAKAPGIDYTPQMGGELALRLETYHAPRG